VKALVADGYEIACRLDFPGSFSEAVADFWRCADRRCQPGTSRLGIGGCRHTPVGTMAILPATVLLSIKCCARPSSFSGRISPTTGLI